MKLTPLDIKLSDSQFFELKKYTALQIAAAFGVKPNQINDYSKSSYIAIARCSSYHSTSTRNCSSSSSMRRKSISKCYRMKIQTTDIITNSTKRYCSATDSKTQMEYLRNGVNGTIIKPNEARRKLDMEDAEGGDVYLRTVASYR